MAYSIDFRKAAVKRYLESEDSNEVVAKTFGIAKSTLQIWVEREKEGVGLEKRPQSGRPRKLSIEQEERLAELIQKQKNWGQNSM